MDKGHRLCYMIPQHPRTLGIPKIILYLFRYYKSMKWEIQYTDILALRQQQCLISANVTLFVKLCVLFFAISSIKDTAHSFNDVCGGSTCCLWFFT